MKNDQPKLHRAAAAGDLEKVQKLLAKGKDVNEVWGEGLTPLCLAVDTGRLEIVRVLLAAGADPFVVYDRDGITLLFDAAKRGEYEILGLLIARGLDPHYVNRVGAGTLHYAAMAVSSAMCTELLIGFGVNLNTQDEDGYTPLITACMNVNVTAVLQLVRAGADKSPVNVYGKTAEQLTQDDLDSFRDKNGEFKARDDYDWRCRADILRILRS